MNRCLSSVAVWVATTVIGLTSAANASAQVLGTFRWQLAPYCNVVTVRIEQKGALFELLGTEDRCDGSIPASTVNGSVHFDVSGPTVSGSLAIVRYYDGFVVNHTISLSQVTLGGGWKDDWGNSGTLVFNPPAPVAGNPRPLTMRGDYLITYPAPAGFSEGAASFAFARQLIAPPIAIAANVIPPGGTSTANCPGSVFNPEAAPGHLCIYERNRSSLVGSVRVFNTTTHEFFTTTPTGFALLISTSSAGQAWANGRWAVSVHH